MAVRAARLPRAAAGPAARRQAGARRDRRAQRQGGAHPAQAAPRRRPDGPLRGAAGDPGRARAGQAPLRIECIDVSHVQGTDVVASLVVFEDGLARKSDYRRFEIRDGAAGGDVAVDRRGRPAAVPPDLAETAEEDSGGHGRRAIPPHRGTRPATVTHRRRPGRPVSTRPPAARAGSPTRRTCSSSTAARPRSRRRRTCWPSSASRRRGVRAGQAAGGGVAARPSRTR